MKLFLYIITLLMLAVPAFAQQSNIGQNTVVIGDGANTSKTIKFKNAQSSTLPGIRYNSSSSKIEISNDGSVWNVATSTAPDVTRLTSGSGTYNTPAGTLWLEVIVVGGGGGSQGSNLNTANNLSTTSLTDGAASTFVSSVSGTIISAAGGAKSGGGTYGLLGGEGGTASVSESSTVKMVNTWKGQNGGHGVNMRSTTDIWAGASMAFGGGTCIAPANVGGAYGQQGVAGAANTGQGGSGAGMANIANSGRMGGAGGGGGCVLAIIKNPEASYTYTVGGGGVGATGDSYAGAPGGNGVIIIRPHYR